MSTARAAARDRLWLAAMLCLGSPLAHADLEWRTHLADAVAPGGESRVSTRSVPVPVPVPRAPSVLASMSLSAMPADKSVGAGGPINRFALDVSGFDPADHTNAVQCVYPGGVRYRCEYAFQSAPIEGGRRRVHLAVPDLGAGAEVIVQLSNRFGAGELRVTLSNPPQLAHEIEALPIPGGGREETRADGKPAPSLALVSFSATTTPAMALTMPPEPAACDRLYAAWSRVSATDAVFYSRFGALNGMVTLEKPVVPSTAVSADNLPLWHITYPAAARRVQFIAHYEVFYRVGLCKERLVSP
jgi:hypothetical protein